VPRESMNERSDDNAHADGSDDVPANAVTASPGSMRLVHVAVSAAIGLLVFVYAQGVGLDALHLFGVEHSFNDQVIYVDAARNLLATGELTTGVIYPSTLLQEYGRNFFYMPGHAVLVALSFALFGDAAWSAMLPNLLAYCVCLTCLYVTGRRLVSPRAGFYAAVAFAFIPIFLVYAFSAMAEMTVLASGLLAFTIFVHLPSSMRCWAAPALLVAPFLFRETAAFWIAPMVALLLTEAGATRIERWRAAMIAFAGSAIALGTVYRLDWTADRPSLFLQNLFGETFIEKYCDAFSVAHIDVDAATISSAIGQLSVRNLTTLVDLLASPTFESLTMHLLFWLPVFAAALAWRTPRLRLLVGAWALFAVTSFVFATLLYRWNFFSGVRQLLPQMTLGLLVLGAALAERTRDWSLRSRTIPTVALWLLSLGLVVQHTGIVTGLDETEEGYRMLLKKTPFRDSGLLVTEQDLGVIYIYDHPQRRFSFPPANFPTVELLEAQHDVRAALVPQPLTPVAIAAMGLRYRGSISTSHFYEEPASGGRRR
jgi:4-amino-4-deoxy-L-arabinose transferase-like glycosyltransferase